MRRGSRLADPTEQVRTLEQVAGLAEFQQFVIAACGSPLAAERLETLQVNVGKVCNQTCRHCHVDAGPDRRESMSREVIEACLNVLRWAGMTTLDITGGAPELHPDFRWLVCQARGLGRHVIDRCNLTILVAPGFEDLPEFLAEHQVEVVASLPCYLEENVDRQRGEGVFQRSLEALGRLNRLGYGRPSSALKLTLVYNPIGASLPPPQLRLEADYRRELRQRYGIEFTRLITITNMPISRFLDDLLQTGRLEPYLQQLLAAFNPATVPGLMCRSMLSVDWQGNLFDCDFNQMLGLAANVPLKIGDLDESACAALRRRTIVTGRHCFGCTAGAGSGCGGQLSELPVGGGVR